MCCIGPQWRIWHCGIGCVISIVLTQAIRLYSGAWMFGIGPGNTTRRSRPRASVSASIPCSSKASKRFALRINLRRGLRSRSFLGNCSTMGSSFPQPITEKCRAILTTLLNTSRQSGMEKNQAKDPGSDEAFELAISGFDDSRMAGILQLQLVGRYSELERAGSGSRQKI